MNPSDPVYTGAPVVSGGVPLGFHAGTFGSAVPWGTQQVDLGSQQGQQPAQYQTFFLPMNHAFPQQMPPQQQQHAVHQHQHAHALYYAPPPPPNSQPPADHHRGRGGARGGGARGGARGGRGRGSDAEFHGSQGAAQHGAGSSRHSGGTHTPSAQELQTARMLRGAPVICNSGSRSGGGSSQSAGNSGAALLATAASLANSRSPQVSSQEAGVAPGAAMLDLALTDAPKAADGPSSSSPADADAATHTSSSGGARPSASPTDSNNTPDAGLGTSRSFKIVRKTPSSEASGAAPAASTVTPPPLAATAGATTTPTGDTAGKIPTHAELCDCLRKHIATTPAEMFLPETALDNVRKQLKHAPIAEAFAKASVGEAMEAVVHYLGDHQARPKGFDPADEGNGSIPLVSAARLVRVLEGLSASHEHFKKHATRTLLNLIADATTDNDQRLCAAVVLGMLFRLAFYGSNDPYQVLVDVLSPYGAVTNPQIACAIARLLAVSTCPVTPAANRLYQLFRPAPAPAPQPMYFQVQVPSYGSTGEPPLPQSNAASGTPPSGTTPPPLDATGELTKPRAAGGDADGSPTAPPPYSANASVATDSLGPSVESAKTQDEAARRRTVYVTRVDPTMSEGELRTILLECGDFNKVRLCGDTPGRCKYCFVEFAAEAGARKMLKLDGRWFGMQQLRVGIAKNTIETNDPRDALFDNARGKVRACVFGLSMKPSQEAQSGRPLANSAPPTVGDRHLQQERKKRNEALFGTAGTKPAAGADATGKGVMGRSTQDAQPSSKHTSASSSGSEPKRKPPAGDAADAN